MLAEFLNNWGNEIFLFLNTKRINPAMDNQLFVQYIKDIFPLSYNEVRLGKASQNTVLSRLAYIVDMLGREFNLILKRKFIIRLFNFKRKIWLQLVILLFI